VAASGIQGATLKHEIFRNFAGPEFSPGGAQRVALPKIIAGWEKVSKVRPHISTTEMIPSKNSTDLDMGRRPELKSIEFFEGIISVVEIFTILCLKPLKKCYTVWEHDPKSLRNFIEIPPPQISKKICQNSGKGQKKCPCEGEEDEEGEDDEA
jgi:hypothetical protein